MRGAVVFLLAAGALAACERAPLPPEPADLAAGGAGPSLAAAPAGATLQQIGSLGGGMSYAHGINDLGQVVGVSYNRIGATRAFLWQEGQGMRELPTLGGWRGDAYAVNDHGAVVGAAELPGYGGVRAFLWTEAGGIRNLGTLGGSSTATAVNNRGQVTGYSTVGNTAFNHAFLWDPALGMIDINPTTPLHTFAHAINDLGMVAGTHYASGGIRPFVWSAATGLVVLPTLGGKYGEAQDVNNLGMVVGRSETASWEIHAFVWTPMGGMRDLGTLGGKHSQAWSVSDDGVVVGWSTVDAENDYGGFHAFMWTAEGGMKDLGALPDLGSYAFAVNNKGMAAGWMSPPWDSRTATVWRFPRGSTPPGECRPPGNAPPAPPGTPPPPATPPGACAPPGSPPETPPGQTGNKPPGNGPPGNPTGGNPPGNNPTGGSAGTTSTPPARANRPPVANAGGAYTVTEGSPLTLSAGASTDPDGDALTYDWDFGDGIRATGKSPVHTYALHGPYFPRLTVRDGRGGMAVKTGQVTVVNVAPRVDAGPDAALRPGQAYTLRARFTDPGADQFRCTVEWGDGTRTELGLCRSGVMLVNTHVYPRAGSYTVRVTVAETRSSVRRFDDVKLTVR
jgi:probable HAF family extracellular repeat protein